MTKRITYQPFGVCDSHVHLVYQDSLEKTIRVYNDIMDWHRYERIVLLGAHHITKGEDPGNNAKVLYCKSVMNAANLKRKVYAFGGLKHYFDERDTADGYLRQVQLIDKMGFDGIKMLEGKPDLRKQFGRRLDDPILDNAYAYAEEHDLPITMHVGDPAANWDINKISPTALARGWFWDETYPTLEQLRQEVEGILTKFPKLRLTLAHFYFMGDDLEGTIDLFEKWPNVSFDLTPGGGMFVGFSKRIEEWKEFFVKYADRLHFGTDTYNSTFFEKLEDYDDSMWAGFRVNQVRKVLEWTEPFEDRFFGRLIPMNLDKDTLQKIYHDNCVNRLGEPRQVNASAAMTYAAGVLEEFERGSVTTGEREKDSVEIENLRKIYEYYYTELG